MGQLQRVLIAQRRTPRGQAIAAVATLALLAGSFWLAAAHASTVRQRPSARSGLTRLLRVDSALYIGPTTLRMSASVTADDLHDTLLAYATRRPCATRYNAAIRQTENEGNSGELADLDLGAATPGASWRHPTRNSWKLTLSKKAIATGFRILCLMLYDAPGDPRYPGNPQNIPADHVWQRAQARIR